ncbi:MAG: hypothetical protein ACP5NX_03115 [Candidatus Bilamarchaeaceae archaeon]
MMGTKRYDRAGPQGTIKLSGNALTEGITGKDGAAGGSLRMPFGYAAAYLRSGGEPTCDDSILVVHMADASLKGAVFAMVLDGIGTSPGSDIATRRINDLAFRSVRELSSSPGMADDPEEALLSISARLNTTAMEISNYSTVTMLLAKEDGFFAALGGGDSPIYLCARDECRMLLPLDRGWVERETTPDEYVALRRGLGNVLGLGTRFRPKTIIGKADGCRFILASDGFMDNLPVGITAGQGAPIYGKSRITLADDTCAEWVRRLAAGAGPDMAVKKMASYVDDTVSKTRHVIMARDGGLALVSPKIDDLSIIVVDVGMYGKNARQPRDAQSF